MRKCLNLTVEVIEAESGFPTPLILLQQKIGDSYHKVCLTSDQADLVVRWILDCKKDVEKEASKL